MSEKLSLVNIADLTPYSNNARTHSDNQVSQIAKSIKEFGFTNPLLVNGHNIIAGHGRVLAAAKLGMTEVPTINLSHLTETQRKAYILADNKLAEQAGWDFDLVSSELKALMDDGFDIDLTGFSVDDILAETTEGLTDEDEVPDPPETPVTVEGDVWILGNHRLMCGDSTSIDAVDKLMAGQKADMVFTDPPYLIETKGGCKMETGKALKKQGDSIQFISNFSPLDFLSLLPILFNNNKMNAYVFCNKDLLPDYLLWARDTGFSFNVLVWKKPNAIPIGGSHRPDIEYLLLFRKSATWNGNINGVNYSRLIECQRETGLHPTMKPVAMLENQMLISSNKSECVFDLFGSSGSTLIACEKTNRNCRMMELDPKYCDVIIKRWQDFTGKTAILESTGEPYQEAA